jgi:cytochrome oxidase assembly protein ShyY1
MDIAALVLSIFAVLISASTLAWQVRRWWWEQRLLVQVEGRSFTYVTNYGEPMPIVGVRSHQQQPSVPDSYQRRCLHTGVPERTTGSLVRWVRY